MDHEANATRGKLPAVSIGLPVYNAERYLRLSLDSLLVQDYRDFELIICDNASTDRTQEICLEYAQNDKRIRFQRNQTNIGAAKNFNHVFRLSSGKYFMWAAHDDLWNPTYISQCVQALEQNPDVVLCGSEIQFIDEAGEAIDWQFNKLNTCGMSLRRRVEALTQQLNWYAFYGVIRSAALRKTHLFVEAFGGDVILLMELLLHGNSLILPQPLFSYRINAKTAERQLEDITGSGLNEDKLRPYTELARSLLHVIDSSCYSNGVKRRMREDLLDNISRRNQRWRSRILIENPLITRGAEYRISAEIRALVAPQMSLSGLARLRGVAYYGHLLRRTGFILRRFLDKHVLWRFRKRSL